MPVSTGIFCAQNLRFNYYLLFGTSQLDRSRHDLIGSLILRKNLMKTHDDLIETYLRVGNR